MTNGAVQVVETKPELYTLDHYRRYAKTLIHPHAWDYYEGGSGNEVTLHDNVDSFGAWKLRPRVLVDVTRCDPAIEVLGTRIRMPIIVAPTAYHKMARSEGEPATAMGTKAAGTIMTASINSSYTLEDIAEVAGPRWLQLYIYEDDLVATEPILKRARQAGYTAIVLTVDRPVFGKRIRDLVNGFQLPPDVRAANFGNADRKELSKPANLTWPTVIRLIERAGMPVILKGILTAEDADTAVQHGAAGVIVSNHGGRQLDGVCSGIEALPEVVNAVAGQAEVYCDGGVRSGNDVVKALALGARAVLVGRPILWGLAVNGADGVAAVLNLLHDDLVTTMKLLGRPSCAEIDCTTVWRP